MLDARNTEVLGGEVDYIVTKWKANKVSIKSLLLLLRVLNSNRFEWKQQQDLYNHVRTFCQTDNPPPPWVPFGIKQKNLGNYPLSSKKVVSWVLNFVILVDTSKKVFAESAQKEEVDSTSEFSQARQAALAEALEAKSKVVKTFTQLVRPI